MLRPHVSNSVTYIASENPAIERGRKKAIHAFNTSPNRRHVVTTTDFADYVAVFVRSAAPAAIQWGIDQACSAVSFTAVCRQHDDGSFTRQLIPVFSHNLPLLASDLTIGEGRAAEVFEDISRYNARYSGNVPADVVEARA